tara:strand:+ start:447 stop:1292 length:846 start_codon:yes stop_codon:yes gene_type:complete
MTLHKFDLSHQYLDSLGIKRLRKYENNVIIGRIDLSEQERQGKIDWRDDGVYLEINGKYQKGFMFNKDYLRSKYGNPRFHLFKCEVIQGFIFRGQFEGFYDWSNSPKVTVTERGTRKEYKDQNLHLCSKCRSILYERELDIISDTENFDNKLKTKNNFIEPSKDIDIFGRPLNWSRISTAYKKEFNYTCENCGFGGKDLKNNFDKRFIDTDHIKADELTNTDKSNLMCLCKLCHAYKDDLHEKNFKQNRFKEQLKNFVEKYRDIIKEKNSNLLKKFDKDYT